MRITRLAQRLLAIPGTNRRARRARFTLSCRLDRALRRASLSTRTEIQEMFRGWVRELEQEGVDTSAIRR